MTHPREKGFPPIAAGDANLLILGSMPGIASMEKQRYYAHPRNAFWPILQALFGWPADLSYTAQCAALMKQQIAVWDVLQSCHRPGSLDSNIDKKSMQLNDFALFFQQHPAIKLVCFNGQTAQQLFNKQQQKHSHLGLRYHLLPSTSPANAAMTMEAKKQAWANVLLAGKIKR